MKHESFEITPGGNRRGLARRISGYGIAAAQAVLFGLCSITANGEEDPQADDMDAQVLTRGPVHEAFAGIVSYNPEPGVIITKTPPEAIEELPPEIRPAGDNISWIPGYWAWDDERSDFLWISGTWRALPPGRQWTTGYWGENGQGYQWTSGYWADSSQEETTYLPRPPVTVEAGPNTEAPSRDYGWTPGSWTWHQERYAWRPGYWAEGRSDWDWIPAQYVWTPRGYVFVDGYWDYSFDRRGVIYAPVYFRSGYQSRPGYSYSPSIAIGLVSLMEHLFLRPDYHHYYFGDYYQQRYRDNGYYAPYAYQNSRHGYDPVYSQRLWEHREDRDWRRNYEESYDYRRDNESARPPRTFADQKRLKLDTSDSRQRQSLMASRFDEMAKSKESPMLVETVSEKERQKLTDQGREVRKTRDQRRDLEKRGESIAKGKAEPEIKPSKVRLPESPIVGRSPDRFPENQAPPKTQRSPDKDSEKERSERKPTPDKDRPEPRKEQPALPEQKPQPEQREPKPMRPEPAPKEKEPKREEPKREEPKREEPKREEPKREEPKPREQGKRGGDAEKPPSEKSPEPEKEESGKSGGKGRK